MDQLDQRILTIVKEPTTKVGRDKKTTYVSMLASFNGAEEWYYIDEDCPQWEDYKEGDIVNAKVKDWGKGRAVKEMQVVEGAASAAEAGGEVPAKGAPKAQPAKAAEFRTPQQIMRTTALEIAAALHPDNTTKLFGDAYDILKWIEYGPVKQGLGEDIEFPEFG
jgi:exosome complex RNA-binding protein Csl4